MNNKSLYHKKYLKYKKKYLNLIGGSQQDIQEEQPLQREQSIQGEQPIQGEQDIQGEQPITTLSDITKIIDELNANNKVNLLDKKIDNNVIMWGDHDKDQHKKFPETELTNIKYVTCGGYHNVGLKNDNTVVTWGSNRLGNIILQNI